eukprot:UN01930
MEQGNMDGARVWAESAIREKTQAQTYLRLSARLTAVQQRVETAIRMNMLTKTMKGVVTSMDSMMKANMDVVKMTKILDQFEQQFQDLDVLDKSMSTSFDSTLATTTPEMDVENLMSQVADEHGLEFQSELDSVGKVQKKVPQQTTTDNARETVVMGGDDAPNLPSVPSKKPSGGSGGGDKQIEDLEARLRRLQGL